ncbi:MAG TPA: hypothetical protein VI543_05590 [Sulfuricaulis sp.]|jgi:hypothetical protein|nr:hypothetical protein [Sulfuricaulis sp.]
MMRGVSEGLVFFRIACVTTFLSMSSRTSDFPIFQGFAPIINGCGRRWITNPLLGFKSSTFGSFPIVSERARQGRLLSTTQEFVELGSADRLSEKWTRHDRPSALVFFTGFMIMA